MKQRVLEVFTRLGHDLTEDTWQAPLIGYFKLDSLDRVELIIVLEQEFNIVIPDDATGEFVTPQDVLDYINTIHDKN